MDKYIKTIEKFKLSQLTSSGILAMDLRQDNIDCEYDLFMPHRDNYYKIVVSLKGDFRLMVDFKEYRISGQAFILLLPDQVYQLSSLTTPWGYFVGFDPVLITKDYAQLLTDWMIDPILFNNETGIPAQVLQLIELLLNISKERSGIYINASSQAILTAVLNLAIAHSNASPGKNTRCINQSSKIEREFKALLKTNFKSWKQPKKYAQALSISASHLNDTLKEVSGISASEQIQQQTLLEAKRLLHFTDLSIKEIGYDLGYEDPNYFSRFFKKSENMTPLEFRRQFCD